MDPRVKPEGGGLLRGWMSRNLGDHRPISYDRPMKPVSLEALIEPIRSGTLLAIPPDYSGVSIAATRAHTTSACVIPDAAIAP